MSEIRTSQYELGGIRHIEVALPNRPKVTVARVDEQLPHEQLVERAERYWQARDNEEAKASLLRRKHNRQVYISFLPTRDVDTTLEGYYAYVLKDRRRYGKYQILEAIEL